jgi:Reverse transcriptase (RNA-dependent DNA polymerase).
MQIHKLNPSTPTVKGLIKIQKPNQPIRPTVNWQNTPAHKLSKLLTQSINQLTPLPFTFNIKNTTQLIRTSKETPILHTHKFASLDISNMYSNIPITETKHIFINIMEFNLLDSNTKHELLTWYDTITKQNYIINKENIIIQNARSAMGAPSSGILSEIFLQYIATLDLTHLTRKHKIFNYL